MRTTNKQGSVIWKGKGTSRRLEQICLPTDAFAPHKFQLGADDMFIITDGTVRLRAKIGSVTYLE